MNDIPYDETNSNNPYLINTNKKEQIMGPEGVPVSAEYIWSKQGKDREDLVEWVFQYYRRKGFPVPVLTPIAMNKSLLKIEKSPLDKLLNAEGFLKNSNSSGLDIIKHFCGSKFYQAKSLKGRSPYSVFSDDELFRKVLKNRMGWNVSFEDGTERPYMFGITDKMILQGIRSSGLGSAISQFKPVVSKFLYDKYMPVYGNVFDYSCGWGARLLGALSCNKDISYYGTDPLTYHELGEMTKHFNANATIYGYGSEDAALYNCLPEMDFIFSSPSYFNLEVYSEDHSQCYNKFSDYEQWMNEYWFKTVENCVSILKKNGMFGVCVVESVNGFSLAKDMLDICRSFNMELVDTYPLYTSKSHLNNKVKSHVKMKNSDVVYILKS